MPVYLLHGFRWPREGFLGVRVHAIVHNLEDCSAEYIQNENSKSEILGSFRKLFPEQMRYLENPKTGQTLDFIEQYDPDDEYGPHVVSQPFAYVCDRVVMIAGGTNYKQTEAQSESQVDRKGKGKATAAEFAERDSKPPKSPASSKLSANDLTAALSVNVEDVMSSGPSVTPQAWEALADIRDKIAEGQKIGWWVVYNGDPDRAFDDTDEDEEEEGDVEAEGSKTPTQEFMNLPVVSPSSKLKDPTQQISPRAASLIKTQPQSQQARTYKQQEVPSQRSSHHQSSTSDTSSRSRTSTTSSSAPSRKSNKGREPPPVSPSSVPVRFNPNPSQPLSAASVGSPTSSYPNTRVSGISNLPEPARKPDNIPEPPKAKEIAKKEGLRKKFFGKRP